MASRYCLPKNLVTEFKRRLQVGEMHPTQLSEMESEQRRDYFASFLGETNARNVNSLFERKLQMKVKKTAMMGWVKEVTGISQRVRQDLVSKIERMTEAEDSLLAPEKEEMFLEDLVSTKMGVNVTLTEVKEITRLSKEITEAKKDQTTKVARIVYGNKLLDMYDYIAELKPGKTKTEQVANILNVPRALRSTFDMSAPFRQGFGMVSRKQFWQGLSPMVKAFFGEQTYRNTQADIITRPNYTLAKKAGLRLTGLGNKLSEREEEFMTTLLDRIPGIRASERAYTGFLAKLRMDVFDALIEKAELMGEDIKEGSEPATHIANTVNNFTGAGRVINRPVDTGAPIMNAIFWSPRKMAATFQMFNPVNYLNPKISKTARQASLRNLLGAVGASVIMLALGRMIGGDTDDDPVSSDWGKIKFGNVRLDITGGNGNYLVLLSRLWRNQSKSTTTGKVRTLGKDFPFDTRGDVTFRWFKNKLSPVASSIADWMYGENAIGEPFELKKEATELVTPLILETTLEAYESDPSMAFTVAFLEFIGFGANTYDSSRNWNDKIGVELNQFRDQLGQEEFDKANDEYNKIINEKLIELLKSDKYDSLSDENKGKLVTKMKSQEKKKIFEKYDFKYKKEKTNKKEQKEMEDLLEGL